MRRLREQDGFTVVEGIVAAMILVLGALGVMQTFDAGTRNTFRAEESQVVNDRLQAELEAIRGMPYAQIALTALPADTANTSDPRWRVSGGQFGTARDGSALAELVVNGAEVSGGEQTVTGGQVSPAPTPFTAGDVSGQIYRFVTWTSDPSCTACGPGAIKRVIVAAKVDESAVSFERAYQEVHTDVVDPEITPDENSTPGGEEPDVSSAQFWLTDTTCNNNSRQAITADHAAHNTRGLCSSGLKTGGTTAGAPDLMYTSAPSITDAQNTFDYATDISPNAADDIGIVMPPTSTGCTLASVLNTVDIRRLLQGLISGLSLSALPGALDGVLGLTGSESNKHQRIHTWVSPPVKGSGGVLVGNGTLDLYTQSINGDVHPGRICVWMSVRQTVNVPVLPICLPLVGCTNLGSADVEVDLPFVNVGLLANGSCRTGTGLNLTNFTYSRSPWPTSWQKISVPMCFAAVNAAGDVIPAALPANSRIVLNLMVDSAGSNGKSMEFMYDAVGYESKLLLESQAVIPF